MINSHYYKVEKRYGVLRFSVVSVYILAALIVVHGLYQLIDSAHVADKAPDGFENAMQNAMSDALFNAQTYVFYAKIAWAAFMVLAAMGMELLLGLEHNQREQIELSKIQIDIEDKRNLESSKK